MTKNKKNKSFRDYQNEGSCWITLSTGEYYPDILPFACELYKPVLTLFGQILKTSSSSSELLHTIAEEKSSWMRIQLCRVFRKYISPETPVEMLKKKTSVHDICDQFGLGFRKISEAQKRFEERPNPDEALCALLWEYKDRGKKGYDLTEKLFEIIRNDYPSLRILGPERAGKDVLMKEVFSEYPNPNRPVDFVLFIGDRPVAIGLARYDSDRGGAQEDDRTGQYSNCANEILNFSQSIGQPLKIIFLNDGPGLLLGSMWRDYADIEESWPDQVKIVTLRMFQERITLNWLLNQGGTQ